MRTIEPGGVIDEYHRFRADVPADLPRGAVRMIAWLPDYPDIAAQAGEGVDAALRVKGIASEQAEKPGDIREDIHTLVRSDFGNAQHLFRSVIIFAHTRLRPATQRHIIVRYV